MTHEPPPPQEDDDQVNALAQELDRSPDAIRRALASLKAKGLIPAVWPMMRP